MKKTILAKMLIVLALNETNAQCNVQFDIVSTGQCNRIYFHNTSVPPIAQWYWDFGDNTFSTVESPVYTYNIANVVATFTVCLTRQETSCINTICQTLILDCLNPNDIGEINNLASLSIFPTLFSTYTTLRSDVLLKEATLLIYDSNGKSVKQMMVSGQTITIQRDNLPAGLYFLRLTDGSKFFSIGKFVITDN